LWVLFDEMDQRMAFEKRPAWLRLPAFDRLRGESLEATNAFSPGQDTIYAVPALTLGRFLAGAAPQAAADLRLFPSGDSNGVNWSTQATVFSEAAALGANVAVVGWYHPYHRSSRRRSAWADGWPRSGTCAGIAGGGDVEPDLFLPTGAPASPHACPGLYADACHGAGVARAD
jgi:hypothetical protein